VASLGGKTIPHCSIFEKLDEGGMGGVCRARQPRIRVVPMAQSRKQVGNGSDTPWGRSWLSTKWRWLWVQDRQTQQKNHSRFLNLPKLHF